MPTRDATHLAVADKRFVARYRTYVQPRDGDACWSWLKSRNETGYGQIEFSRNGVRFNLLAHRVAWALHIGDIPSGFLVCHKCDVRDCVNPNHLFLGTANDNTQDMLRKGRHRADAGEECHNALLTEEDISLIRGLHRKGLGASFISRIFGVRPCTITNLCAGRSWKHTLQ